MTMINLIGQTKEKVLKDVRNDLLNDNCEDYKYFLLPRDLAPSDIIDSKYFEKQKHWTYTFQNVFSIAFYENVCLWAVRYMKTSQMFESGFVLSDINVFVHKSIYKNHIKKEDDDFWEHI